ncbi:ABC transporter ATP-binding protein [Paenibacillus pseudetheri]|uniref:Leukotoxin export ATP-binding protein LtxB n=1 Tax=Paenibacillus pseudetheri TaxID=2897682 RepID=A0ABN8FSM8_9BACL|nr:ABC transporter ATP-binding protein [Paenibacillus pseudetheri]CAH1059534.1 Leukotoxin export ATP-binding protein LtxB [Paenibacillus pseudetheri]
MLKSDITNLVMILVRMVRKSPMISTITIILPIISGLLTFYSYAVQVNIINGVARGVMTLLPILWFVVIHGVQACSLSITNMMKNRMNAELTLAFQSELIDIANRVDFEDFDDEEFGNKLQRAKKVVGEDLEGITGFLVSSVGIIAGLLSIIWLSATSGYFLVTFVVTLMIVTTLSIRLFTEIKVRRTGRELTFDGRMGDYLANTLEDPNAIREMRIYNSISYFTNLWAMIIKKQHNKRFSARKFEIKTGMVVAMVQTSAIFVVLVYLLNKMGESNTVTIGTISVLFLALLSSGGKIMSLTWPLSKLYISSSKLYDFNEVLTYKNRDFRKININNSTDSMLPITVSNVYFKYAKSNKNVLSNINMTIKPGEKIAIVGENGAGKSTLIKMLLGQYRPSSGTICWKDSPEPNGKVSVVFQNAVKFELTLRENIFLGDAHAPSDDAKILSVLEQCELIDLLHEIGGLDVKLGQLVEGSRQLSGGQWQKLAIARALYNDAELIVFDEPTSAIDPNAEMEIYTKLLEICQDKAAIFISHRLGWAKNVDTIYVMSNGEIAEVGDHQDLVHHKGIYASMYALQSSWYK